MLTVFASTSTAENEETDSPTYSIPVRPPIFQFAGDLPSVELVGLDLRQDGDAIRGEVPEVVAGSPLDITLHLRPISERVSDRQLRINLRPPGTGPAPGFLDTFEFGLKDWRFRHVYRNQYRIELPRRQFAGRGTLSFWDVDPLQSDWRQAARLYAMEVFMPATVWESTVDDAKVSEVFGVEHIRLHKAFTIGPDTQVQIPLHVTDAPISAIGIISNATWTDSIEAGEVLSRITVTETPSERESTYPIRYAEHTFRMVVTNDELAAVATRSSIAWADRLPGDGERYRCFYSSIVELAQPVEKFVLRIEYMPRAGLLHVYEIVAFAQP